MSLKLPENLFTSHRLIEDAELTFRLSDKFRASLLMGSDAPLPTNLPRADLPPLQATLALARHLTGIFGHFVRLDDAAALINDTADRIMQMAHHSPDGSIAALLMVPYADYTPHHAINCALLAARTAESLQLDAAEARPLVSAVLTMNLGSAEIQNQMAHQDSPPTTLQRQVLDIHPLLSSAMLREAKIDDRLWHSIVLMHHERKDGKGYTFGAKEHEIPPLAHLAHLLDIITAKLMPRSYRSSVPPKTALASLYAGTSESFDGHYVSQVVKILGIYPPGSFIEMENGERALVIKNGKTAAAPLVAPVKSPGQTIDTADAGYHVKRGVSMRVESRHIPMFTQYWS